MRAAYAARQDQDDPLEGLVVGEIEPPTAPPGWVRVTVRAAALNHHDLWSLRGVGLPSDRLPMVLGCDAAGVTEDGREVIVHAVVGDPAWTGDETLDPARTLLSELHLGTFAEHVLVPARNVVDKAPELTFAEAACLPTAWLTAYRMLTTVGRVRAGDTVLVQGATGGVAGAAITLARLMGARVAATSRSEAGRALAADLGAHEVLESGERLSGRADLVVESVGQATWAHSLRSLRPGGSVVVCGATSGDAPPAELNRVFFRSLNVLGSTMGTRDELEALQRALVTTGVRPRVEVIGGLDAVPTGLRRMARGEIAGKLVVEPSV
ncbi:zinc-binding dehydrogenase [Georgenia sp. Z1491]|uniref:zinc-binding dehydrogenase n=1 Tax=Georgenia sp. Z1491 TaxID=3416707 RepID=UPI003CE7F571